MIHNKANHKAEFLFRSHELKKNCILYGWH